MVPYCFWFVIVMMVKLIVSVVCLPAENKSWNHTVEGEEEPTCKNEASGMICLPVPCWGCTCEDSLIHVLWIHVLNTANITYHINKYMYNM